MTSGWNTRFFCVVLAVVLSVGCGAPTGERSPNVSPTSGNVADETQQSGEIDPVNNGKARKPMQLSPVGKQYFDAGVMAGASGELGPAEAAFQKAIKTDPEAPQPYYNLGVVYERRGADLKALKHYRQALHNKGDYLPALSAAAKLLLRYGKGDEAIQLVRSVVGRNNSDVDLIVLYANVLSTAGKYEDAIRTAKKALRIDERSAGAMLQIGKANLKMGRLELAESIFNQVLTINDNIAEVYFLFGLLELKKGFRILAIKKYEKAIELNPFYPEALNNLALEYMLAGNYGAAIELLERAIQITPSWGILYLNYGNALRGAGKWKRAVAALNRAGKMMPDSPAVTYNLAILHYAADSLGALSRVARLKKARALFFKYKSQKGAELSSDDNVYKYIKELDLLIEREQVRAQRQKEAAEREKQKAKFKSVPNNAPSSGDESGNAGSVDESGSADDEGWE